MASLNPILFAMVPAGRAVQTNAQRIDTTRFVFMLENPMDVNHLCVFLTAPLPLDAGANVYFGWKNEWRYLGYLTNAKPSAVFRISSTRRSIANLSAANANDTNGLQEVEMEDASTGIYVDHLPSIAGAMGTLRATPMSQDPANEIAQIGISIEPIVEVEKQALAHGQTSNTPTSDNEYLTFAMKMLQHFYHFATSYATTHPTMQETAWIPASVLEKWYQAFQTKLRLDPKFWKE